MRGDPQAPLFQAYAVKLASLQFVLNLRKPMVQNMAAILKPCIGVCFQPLFSQFCFRRFARDQVTIKAPIILATFHPNIASTQPMTQRGHHSSFIDSALGLLVSNEFKQAWLDAGLTGIEFKLA